MLFSRLIAIRLKVNLFKTAVVSVLLYGCESWIVSESMANQINSFATSCYRIMLSIRKLDKVPNSTVLERVNEPPLLNDLHSHQLRKLSHSLRLSADEPAKIFALYEPAPAHGKEKRGAHRQSFRE